ncbi:glycosyltransferase family 4 protein [Robertkochia aurantiaca]|uniref:glycosyltransferase family 4 protein n=1 Tax=Robertkochia aurantiaca TaxID=2873700 RepID=UPI001CCD2A89|nr:glycosyltransferase family 4 protein [Robertkochia sp. 3YJGBD-33]
MRCLHLCNDFQGSKVHQNLYCQLSALHISQTVFYPDRKKQPPTANFYPFKLIKSIRIPLLLRLFFRAKIQLLYRDLTTRNSIEKFDFVHATTLFSDGAIALKLKTTRDIPYIVAVRSTDINIFFRFRPDLHGLALKILKNADAIIFLTPVLKKKTFRQRFLQNHLKEFESKSVIIPNGVEDYWLSDRYLNRSLSAKKVLYAGTFNKRKNALSLIDAIVDINNQGCQIELSLVGQKGSLSSKVKRRCNEYNFMNYLGMVNDRNELKGLYRAHDIFVLPSWGETFGLVYLEALSQGMVVLHMKNEGIDGLIRNPYGPVISGKNSDQIKKALIEAIENYSSYNIPGIDLEPFSWKYIAKTYFDLYKNLINENPLHSSILQNS